jgi:hypothetical protein
MASASTDNLEKTGERLMTTLAHARSTIDEMLAAPELAPPTASMRSYSRIHLSHARQDPSLLHRLEATVIQRHDALAHTAGLNEEVFDALVLLAAGSWDPDAIEAGFERVVRLKKDMDAGRRVRLLRLGFSEADAARPPSTPETSCSPQPVRASTREARIRRCTERILSGKGLRDSTCGRTKRPPGCDGSHKLP